MPFRGSSRHGTADQGYGGTVGVTPPTTPPRSSTPPRRLDRTGRGFVRSPTGSNYEPNERGPGRERSRDRSPHSAAGARQEQPLPSEWGGRTLRTERMISELTARVNELNATVVAFQSRAVISENRLNALEQTLPKRLHQIEARQATRVELLNTITQSVHMQFESLYKKIGEISNGAVPNFGGATPRRFGIATPPDSPFAPAPNSATSAAPSQQGANYAQPQTPDPWARSRWDASASVTPAASAPAANLDPTQFNKKDWKVTEKKD